MDNNTPHVAIYINCLSGGGAERVVVNLMHGFVKQNIQVDLVINRADCSYYYTEVPYLNQLPSQARVIELKANRPLTALLKLTSYLRREHPAALLAVLHYQNEIAILAKKLSGVSTQLVVREGNTISVKVQNTHLDRWSPLLARLSYPWADGIIAVSQGVAKDLAKITGIPLERIQVIYNPSITPNIFALAKEPLDHPWFVSREVPVILGVGRLEKQKDFPTLIRAFAQVRQVRPARLVILGSGPEQKKLWALVQQLGLEDDVAMLGFVDNPYVYMARADVLVSSSLWEGLSNVLIETMALGTPVVATDCPSGTAEILNNGKYGELVSVGNSRDIAQAILQSLSGNSKSVDPCWLKQFTLEIATQKYLDALGVTVGSSAK